MSGRGGRGPGFLIWGAVVAVVVAVTVAIAPDGSTTGPYDLSSTEPDGYRGLDLLLDRMGASVEDVDAGELAGAIADDGGAAFDIVFVPASGGATRREVAAWREFAASGGRVVLGEPSPHLGGRPASDGGPVPGFAGAAVVSMEPGVCDIATLRGIGPITVPYLWTWAEPDPARDTSCFGDGDAALVVRRPVGSGEVVTLAVPDLFTNATMGAPAPEAPVGPVRSNAVLAQRLLATRLLTPTPDPGAPRVRVAIVTSGLGAVAAGEKTVTDHMSWGVRLGLLQLVVAFAWYAVASARRHGRVVTEEAPVDIAGSAFVEAVGGLYERQGDCGRAAEILREGECRTLARRLGAPPTIGRSELAAVVAARTDREATAVQRLLTDPVEDRAELVELAQALDSLREETLHV